MSTEIESVLVRQLRDEAGQLKECFTRFAFQSLALTTAILGLVSKFQPDNLYVGLTGAPLILLLFAVIRIGLYKYAGANRNYGYELYLSMTRYRSDGPHKNGWKQYMRSIGWEEAMRAWRIVQATMYVHLYDPQRRNSPEHAADDDGEQRWYELNTQLADASEYYAGSYLRTMMTLLYVAAALSFLPVIVLVFQAWDPNNPLRMLPIGAVAITTLGIAVFQMRRYEARRLLVENGFLSIHSCAVMWQAVVVAHFRALRSVAEKESDGDMDADYIRELSHLCEEMKSCLSGLRRWIQGDPVSE